MKKSDENAMLLQRIVALEAAVEQLLSERSNAVGNTLTTPVIVRDPSGRTVFSILSGENGPIAILFDEKEHMAIALGAHNEGQHSGIQIRNSAGEMAVRMQSLDEGGGLITVHNGTNDKIGVIVLGDPEDGGAITVRSIEDQIVFRTNRD